MKENNEIIKPREVAPRIQKDWETSAWKIIDLFNAEETKLSTLKEKAYEEYKLLSSENKRKFSESIQNALNSDLSQNILNYVRTKRDLDDDDTSWIIDWWNTSWNNLLRTNSDYHGWYSE